MNASIYKTCTVPPVSIQFVSLKTANRKKTRKMKLVMFIMTLLVAVSAIFAFQGYVQRPRPGSSFPYPGTPPFNPKIRWPYPGSNLPGF